VIYIVSGYRRSGTSCMMRCLQSGGITALIQPGQEKLNIESNGYAPNPGPLMEVGQQFYHSPKFLRILPTLDEDACVKILFDGIPGLAKGEYTVIFMERDPEEIRESLEKSDSHLKACGKKPNPMDKKPFDVFLPYDRANIEHVLGICEVRSDIDLRIVRFTDLISRPEWVLRGLPLPTGFNFFKAASIVNPEYYRSRNDSSESRREGVGA